MEKNWAPHVDPKPVCFILSSGDDPQVLDEACILPSYVPDHLPKPVLSSSPRWSLKQLQLSFFLADLGSFSRELELNLKE